MKLSLVLPTLALLVTPALANPRGGGHAERPERMSRPAERQQMERGAPATTRGERPQAERAAAPAREAASSVATPAAAPIEHQQAPHVAATHPCKKGECTPAGSGHEDEK